MFLNGNFSPCLEYDVKFDSPTSNDLTHTMAHSTAVLPVKKIILQICINMFQADIEDLTLNILHATLLQWANLCFHCRHGLSKDCHYSILVAHIHAGPHQLLWLYLNKYSPPPGICLPLCIIEYVLSTSEKCYCNMIFSYETHIN